MTCNPTHLIQGPEDVGKRQLSLNMCISPLRAWLQGYFFVMAPLRFCLVAALLPASKAWGPDVVHQASVSAPT